VIDALQLADARQIATPADWEMGDAVIIPTSVVCVFQLKLGADSRATWAPVPGDRGRGFQTMLGTVSS
jgi:hypothetical protein